MDAAPLFPLHFLSLISDNCYCLKRPMLQLGLNQSISKIYSALIGPLRSTLPLSLTVCVVYRLKRYVPYNLENGLHFAYFLCSIIVNIQ